MVQLFGILVLTLALLENLFINAFSIVPSRTVGITTRREQRRESLIQRKFFNFGKQEEAEDVVDEPVVETEEEVDGAYDAEDPVEKIFGFFFGKREAAPMGLKRMTKEQFPERYPATKTEWAEPVSTDDNEMALIRPLLKNTNLESRSLQLAYDANRDGWDPTAFHSKVDKKGPSVVFCRTDSGLVCGGYNPKGWVSYGEARGSIAAFLFVLGGKYALDGPACKLQKVGGPSLAQMDMPETGPQFSPDALVIPLAKNNPRVARSKLGSYYERFPDGTNSLFGNSGSAKLKEFKVYQGVYQDGEFIPFTDAEPFALY